MKQHPISAELLEALHQYLMTKPMVEVEHLVAGIRATAKQEITVEPKPDENK